MMISFNQILQILDIMCEHFRGVLLFSGAYLGLFCCFVIIKKTMRR